MLLLADARRACSRGEDLYGDAVATSELHEVARAIEGEMELTVGAPGILMAAVGAVAGFIYGLRRRPGT